MIVSMTLQHPLPLLNCSKTLRTRASSGFSKSRAERSARKEALPIDVIYTYPNMDPSWSDSFLANLSTGSWKLTKATGRAAWIAGTIVLILAVPLIVEMDREAQVMELENQQLGALTGGSPSNK